MSASLVGSEMCIRDRVQHRPCARDDRDQPEVGSRAFGVLGHGNGDFDGVESETLVNDATELLEALKL
eukprot:13998641-Alexandrium_andersonii.AAC.1